MTVRLHAWVVAGTLALTALVPAVGQAQPATPGNGTAAVSPSYPSAPFQQPGIVQNQVQMRATSPRPNQYLGGAYNPVYPPANDRRFTPRRWYYPSYTDAYGRPLWYGYGSVRGPLYDGYALPFGYSIFPSWSPQHGLQGSVIVPPQIIYVQPGYVVP